MNSLEKKIHSFLEHKPLLRSWTVYLYQRMISLLPRRLDPPAILPKTFPNFFFGFHDKIPFSANDRYLLCHQLNSRQANQKQPRGPIVLSCIDLETDRVITLGQSLCWNYQQGSSLQWQGKKLIAIYNNLDSQGRPIASRTSLDGQPLEPIKGHICHIAANGELAVGYDFRALNVPDKDYGYPQTVKSGHGGYPVCLQVTELDKTTNPRVIVRLEDILSHPDNELELASGSHYFSHALFSRDSRHIAFFHRCRLKYGKLITRLYVSRIDGSELRGFPMVEDISHISWDDKHHIFAFAKHRDKGWRYYEISHDASHITASPLMVKGDDGHPSIHNDQVITDTYPDKHRIQSLVLFCRKTLQSRYLYQARIPFRYRGGYRCDFHPRWNHRGDMVCFDSAESGTRSINLLPVGADPC
jgi:hypothetical protein